MVNSDIILMLCSDYIKNKQITTKELNMYGINSYVINKLLIDNLLIRSSRGLYIFNLNNVFDYVINNFNSSNSELVFSILYKCCELDFKYIDKCYGLLGKNILNYNNDLIFILLDILLSFDNKYIPNINLYIYLLSFIVEMPERYKEYISNINLKDMLSDDKNFNNIIKKIYYTKLFEVKNEINKLNYNDSVLITLLEENIKKDNINREKIINFINEKKYNELKLYLENKNKKYNLTFLENKIDILLVDLLLIIENKEVPKIEISDCNDVFKAIDGNNFKLAFKLSNEYSLLNNLDKDSNVIYLLLKDICNEIDKLSYYFDIV